MAGGRVAAFGFFQQQQQQQVRQNKIWFDLMLLRMLTIERKKMRYCSLTRERENALHIQICSILSFFSFEWHTLVLFSLDWNMYIYTVLRHFVLPCYEPPCGTESQSYGHFFFSSKDFMFACFCNIYITCYSNDCYLCT